MAVRALALIAVAATAAALNPLGASARQTQGTQHSSSRAAKLGRRDLGAALIGAAVIAATPVFAQEKEKLLEEGTVPPAWDPRRDYLVGPERNAISDYEVVPSQRAPPGKVDINNALVTDYKQFSGMYPHAAGVIASNGPYQSVDDLFRLSAANDNDKALFRKYKNDLTALPPGRMFNERINARQST